MIRLFRVLGLSVALVLVFLGSAVADGYGICHILGSGSCELVTTFSECCSGSSGTPLIRCEDGIDSYIGESWHPYGVGSPQGCWTYYQ
jgi:hypothetical protein